MSTTAVSGTSSSTSLTDALSSSQKLGQEQFLKLLVTQMTNQDPLSPEDDKSFLAEMAQFSAVDAMSSVSSSMSKLQAASMIGKTVSGTVSTDTGQDVVSGTVSAVTFTSSGVKLTVGDKTLDLGNVTQVQ
jgi:flagellar basal-body rod modification protein FlgD